MAVKHAATDKIVIVKPIELIESRRLHAARLAAEGGSAGELNILAEREDWTPRPRGAALKNLLAALRSTGITIKGSSFDAISLPKGRSIDFSDATSVRTALPEMVFIEIKTSNQERVDGNFTGYFFALTEGEIAASEVLGERHRVALYNRRTGSLVITSVAAILARARSMNWQVSVQL